MKRILSIAAMAALLTTSAQADVVRVEAGAGIWNVAPSGDLTLGADTVDLKDDLGLDSGTAPYVWIYLKHPVPVIPNIRLEYTDVNVDGSSTQTFNFAGKNFSSQFDTGVQVKQYDLALYYNILDNTFWTTVDLGLDIKYADMKFDIQETGGAFDSYSESGSIVVPTGYIRARVQIPATEIGIEADMKYVAYSGVTVSDARIKVDYTMDFIPVIQPGLEVGYRVERFAIDNSNIPVETDITFAGVYGGLMLRF